MADMRLPRGVRDLMPNEALFRNELLKKIEAIFQSFGFLTIETPVIENLDILRAKGGIGEDTKLIYEMKDERIGLRYDNTVSLARYMDMHQHLPLPFKRYYIGKVWRREEPQRLRYREITQADADIVGGDQNLADAEILALGDAIFDAIGIKCTININDRALLEKTLTSLGAGKHQVLDIERALDKIDKIGEQKVTEMIEGIGIEKTLVGKIMKFISLSGSNEKKLDEIDKILGETLTTSSLRRTLDKLKAYDLKGKVVFNTSIMRGLDYYTGIVFEFKDASKPITEPTLCGGGRYDNLTEILGGKRSPGVGFAIGIDRILEILEFSSSTQYSYAKVFVAYIKENNYGFALSVASALRAAGIPAEINISSRNLSNQLSYASSIKTNYVIIIGDAEERSKSAKLRNLIDGKEQMLSVRDLVKFVKGELNGKV